MSYTRGRVREHWRRHWRRYLCAAVFVLLLGVSLIPSDTSLTAQGGGMSLTADITVVVTPDYAADMPTVVTGNETGVSASGATLHGNVTATGGTTITERGFVWGNATHGMPGNATAPADTAYTDSWTEAGSWGTGAFSRAVTGLSSGVTYYFRAAAYNGSWWAYGDEGNFTTPTTIYPPTDFTVTQTGVASANATWTMGVNASETYIRVKIGSAPEDRTDGYLFYVGSGTWADDDGLALEISSYCYSAWGYDGNATYSADYASGCVGGDAMATGLADIGTGITSFAMILLAVGLTVAMFGTRNMLLGFPCLIFWAILGGYFYLQSAATWDIDYFLFFASMGMAIFCGYAAYALRKSDLAGPDADKGAFFDEGGSRGGRGGGGGFMEKPDSDRYIDEDGSDDGFSTESKPSWRTRELRARAARRRSGEGASRKQSWGEFR